MASSKRLLTIGCFIAFFAFGFCDNLKGPLLPELLRGEDYSYRQGGTILLAAYVGFIVATLTTGVLADVVGNRGVLLLAGICLSAGSVGIAASSSYFMLVASMGVSGIGLGAIELGANGLIVELHDKKRGRYLNLLATCHGFGALTVPIYASAMLSVGWSWRQIFGSTAAFCIPLFVLFFPSTSKRPSSAFNEDELQPLPRRNVDWTSMRRNAFSKDMRYYYVLIAAYVAVELSVAAWMVEYLQQLHGRSVASSTLFLSAFFVLLMLGRLLGAWVIGPIGYDSAIATALISSSFCLVGGVWGPKEWVWLLPLSGFFLSIIFPTVTAAASDLHKAHMGSMLGLLFACAGVGGALGPWSVGWVSELAGLRLGMTCPIVFEMIAISALIAIQLQRRTKT